MPRKCMLSQDLPHNNVVAIEKPLMHIVDLKKKVAISHCMIVDIIYPHAPSSHTISIQATFVDLQMNFIYGTKTILSCKEQGCTPSTWASLSVLANWLTWDFPQQRLLKCLVLCLYNEPSRVTIQRGKTASFPVKVGTLGIRLPIFKHM